MKKQYVIGGIILFIVIFTIISILLFNNMSSNFEKKTKSELAQKQIETKNQEYNIEMVSTSSIQEKTSPTAILIFKTKYNKCNHTATERVEIPKEDVNKTGEEIKNEYEDWNIEKFSANEIILNKEKNGICNQHYVLRDKEGYLAIYTIDENNNETLKEMTAIVTNYLPEADMITLREGIYVNGEEELNATIEDYE